MFPLKFWGEKTYRTCILYVEVHESWRADRDDRMQPEASTINDEHWQHNQM